VGELRTLQVYMLMKLAPISKDQREVLSEFAGLILSA
jgi:hypothetical protein